MLENEGFRYEGYIDIFDGGPTMTAPTDEIRTIRDSRELVVGEVRDEVSGQSMMLATGRQVDFRACCGPVAIAEDESAAIDRRTADLLEVGPGDVMLAMSR
jgi:arginine N-succinyltransferase